MRINLKINNLDKFNKDLKEEAEKLLQEELKKQNPSASKKSGHIGEGDTIDPKAHIIATPSVNTRLTVSTTPKISTGGKQQKKP